MKELTYRDPVHDFITVEERLYKRLIDATEFQRLRRIKQLGAAYGTYHGADHTRFGHSLGAFWIATSVVERLRAVGVPIDERLATVLRAAALLHDVGHGPFSHALEGYITPGKDHEHWTVAVLSGPTEVRDILADHDETLPQQVASMVTGTFDGPAFVRDLVSSQLDVDRMDYLLRDCYYAGVTYGRYDLARIISTLHVHDDRLVVMAKGIVALEEYLLARYLMYWQVYLHKTVRSHEAVLRSAWHRARTVAAQGDGLHGIPDALVTLLTAQRVDDRLLASYLNVDDNDVVVAMKAWRRCDDAVLSDLAARFLDRRLFKAVFRRLPPTVDEDALAQARDVVRQAGYDPDYYLIVDDVRRSAYDPYRPDGPEDQSGQRPVWVLGETGERKEVTTVSATVRSLASQSSRAVNVFAPEDVIERVRVVLGAAPS